MSDQNLFFDVVVIGGGYVGCEVVVVVVCMGVCIVFVIYMFEIIGVMFCNFVIGGLGKGYFVCEIDVFDGLMGCVVDQGGIQFCMFNWCKGLVV